MCMKTVKEVMWKDSSHDGIYSGTNRGRIVLRVWFFSDLFDVFSLQSVLFATWESGEKPKKKEWRV